MIRRTHRATALAAALLGVAGAAPARSVAAQPPDAATTCASANVPVETGVGAAAVRRAPSLRTLFADDFRVGTALNVHQFSGRDTTGIAIATHHFDTVTPENVLKWECVHPAPDRYTFDLADRYVAFGERHRMFVVGHTLVWHSQTPRWVFQDAAGQPVGRDTLLARMRAHIQTVVGRYRGRIGGWDVVNEALNEDGTLRDSPWRRIIGDDYLVHAFRYAHEADPQAQLYYNDYSLENAAKRDGAVRIVRMLQAAGVPVAAVGTQQHVKLAWPTIAQVESTFVAFGALGVKVAVTELDVDVLPPVTRSQGADVATRGERAAGSDPYAAALPDSVQRALAERYAGLFAAYRRHRDVLDRVTFWGIRDGDSWLNYWPVRGRTSYPLLFDRAGRPKPAFDAVARTARGRAADAGRPPSPVAGSAR